VTHRQPLAAKTRVMQQAASIGDPDPLPAHPDSCSRTHGREGWTERESACVRVCVVREQHTRDNTNNKYTKWQKKGGVWSATTSRLSETQTPEVTTTTTHPPIQPTRTTNPKKKKKTTRKCLS
jgi:hypothetical protein